MLCRSLKTPYLAFAQLAAGHHIRDRSDRAVNSRGLHGPPVALYYRQGLLGSEYDESRGTSYGTLSTAASMQCGSAQYSVC